MAKMKNCKACGNEVSSSAKTCPKCGHKQKSGFFKKLLIAVAIFFGIAILLGLIAGEPSESNKAGITPSAPSNSANASPASNSSGEQNGTEVVEAAPDPRPADQVEFVDIVLVGQADAKNAENDMQLGAILNQRDQQLCQVLNSNKTVSNWIAEVADVSANSDGKGVITLLIAKDAELGTWNNAFSDISHQTLVEPNTPIFNTGASLKRGDIVQFSGEFFTDPDEGCLVESSLTLRSKVRSPYFIFRFSDLAKVNAQ